MLLELMGDPLFAKKMFLKSFFYVSYKTKKRLLLRMRNNSDPGSFALINHVRTIRKINKNFNLFNKCLKVFFCIVPRFRARHSLPSHYSVKVSSKV